MALRKDVILVTGSSGLIGTATVRRLARRFTVIGFDRPGEPHPSAHADCVDVDLASERSVRDGLRYVSEQHGRHIASVIHLAAYYDFSGKPSPLYDVITVRGTAHLLQALQAFRVEQFVFSSTVLVHAPCDPGQTINEDWPLQPKWAFPESNAKTEEVIRAQHGDIPYVLLRIAGAYDNRGHSIPLAHQIQRIYERRLSGHLYPGDTQRGQPFLHLSDLVDALQLCVERRSRLPRELALLLGEPDTVSYDELQRAFGRLIHREVWETHQIPKSLAKTGAWVQDKFPLGEEPFVKPFMIDLADDHYALNIARAESILGWRPKFALRETVPCIVEALRTDPAEWYKTNHLQPPPELSAIGHLVGSGIAQ
jgi:nucleoside-diphosphate-sugar epimerase